MNKILTISILIAFLFNFSSVVFAQTKELGVSTNETIALYETSTKGNQTVASTTPAQVGTFAPTSGPLINIGFANGTSKSDQVANTATPEEIFPLFIDPKTLVINGKTKGRLALSDQILNIYNMQGVLVQSEYISADDSQRTFEFNLTNLENGMYIAELSSDTQRTTEQLLIQN